MAGTTPAAAHPNLHMRAIPLIRLSPDDTLARRAASGDDDAFALLYDRYRVRLEAYCRGILRHDEDAGDAAQSALANALQALRRGAEPAAFRPWLFRIAHNEAITVLRRRRVVDELPESLPGRTGVAETAELREELTAVLEAVRTLPTGARSALLLRELAGLEYPEVANVLGTTTGGARQAVFEARTALQDDRAGRGTDCAEIRQELSVHDGRRRQARHIRGHLRGCGSCREWSRAQRSRRRHLALGGAPLPLAGWLAGIAAAGAGTGSGATISTGMALNAQALAAIAAVTIGAAPVVVERERPKPAAAALMPADGMPAQREERAAEGRREVVPILAVAKTSSVETPTTAVVRTTARTETRGPEDGRSAGSRPVDREEDEGEADRAPPHPRWAAEGTPRRRREAPPAREAAVAPVPAQGPDRQRPERRRPAEQAIPAPAAEAPVAEPVVEAPVLETPVAEQPAAEEPAAAESTPEAGA
ncbi:MAG: sigma-70 family RNA polymerase sigma factor [Solirubrobacteraceae bacterium]|nr:sigma-70 family RNA polymerase sigma factor [Solirubrobacteraceae bacterium]